MSFIQKIIATIRQKIAEIRKELLGGRLRPEKTFRRQQHYSPDPTGR